jgi:hypothetical protein
MMMMMMMMRRRRRRREEEEEEEEEGGGGGGGGGAHVQDNQTVSPIDGCPVGWQQLVAGSGRRRARGRVWGRGQSTSGRIGELYRVHWAGTT